MYSKETMDTVIRKMCLVEERRGKRHTIHMAFCAIEKGDLQELNRICWHSIEMALYLYCMRNGIKTVNLGKREATRIIREYVIEIYEGVKWVF